MNTNDENAILVWQKFKSAHNALVNAMKKKTDSDKKYSDALEVFMDDPSLVKLIAVKDAMPESDVEKCKADYIEARKELSDFLTNGKGTRRFGDSAPFSKASCNIYGFSPSGEKVGWNIPSEIA